MVVRVQRAIVGRTDRPLSTRATKCLQATEFTYGPLLTHKQLMLLIGLLSYRADIQRDHAGRHQCARLYK